MKQNTAFQLLFKRYPAFSLIEIAIALVIIGIMIGGVLKGQDLLHNARLSALISQINQYRLSTVTFVDRYGALPGDFDKASTLIDSSLSNGNNNGIIQGPGAANPSSGSNYQATSFWAHLAAADMIPDPGTKQQTATVGPNQGFPSTKLGGGITVCHNPAPGLEGHWYVIGQHVGSKTNGGLFTPKDALAIMQKLDTPDPLSGSIQVRNGVASGSKNSDHQCLKDNKLNMSLTSSSCVLYVKF